MGFYCDYFYPKITDWVGGNTEDLRREFLESAAGIVLEVGPATADNLVCYNPEKTAKIYLVEPHEPFGPYIKANQARTSIESEWLPCGAEHIPLPDDSIDTVVSLATLCTIADVPAVLDELARVLKPTGQFIFFEHGLAPDAFMRFLQHLENPLHRFIFGGCNLTRTTPPLIEAAGFEITEMESAYVDFKWWMPKYWLWAWVGIARLKSFREERPATSDSVHLAV